MRTLELTDRAYETYLKPYYENLTRERAVMGSLFSVDTSVFTDDELKRYVSTLVRDFLDIAVTERHLYHILRSVFLLPEEFRLDDHTISFEEDENDKA